MTIETEDGGGLPITKSGPYNGNGVTSAFNYDFQIQAESELTVTRQNADGTEDVLTLTTDYTVSGVGADAGGQITLLDPATDLPSGTKLVIQYKGDYDQPVDFSNQGSIQLGQLEVSLDKITMHLRSLKEIADRSVTVDAFGSADIDTLRTNINILADIEADVTAAAGVAANVTTVAGIAANVTTVAGVAANVTTVAGVSADVTTVAGISADVSTVAGIAADVTNAEANANAAIAAKNAAELAYDNFDDRWLGDKAADPTLDNDGNTLLTGAAYWNTALVPPRIRIYDGAAWQDAAAGALLSSNNLSDLANAATARTNLGLAIGSNVQAWSAALDSVSGTNTGDEAIATDTVAGIVELATTAEGNTGTATDKIPSVDVVKSMIDTHAASGWELVSAQEPTSDVSSISWTGLNAAGYGQLKGGAFTESNSIGNLVLEVRASAGTWRAIAQVTDDGPDFATFFEVYNVNDGLASNFVMGRLYQFGATGSPWMDRSAANKTVETNGASSVGFSSHSETIDEVRIRRTSGNFEGSTADQRTVAWLYGQ